MEIKQVKSIINSESKIWQDSHPEHREAIRMFSKKLKIELDIAKVMEGLD